MKQPVLIRLFMAFSFVVIIVCSFISSTTGQITDEPDQTEPLLSPHPFAFAIWFVIYLGLFIWTVRSFFRQNQDDREATDGIGGWAGLAMILSGISIVVPEKWSIFFIAGALLMLMGAYTRMKYEHSPSLYIRWPISMFIAWISVATIVDAFVVLNGIGVTSLLGINEAGWTLIMLIISILLANAFMYKQNDLLYGGVFAWAYLMLILNRPAEWVVALPSIVGLIALFVTALIVIRKRKKHASSYALV